MGTAKGGEVRVDRRRVGGEMRWGWGGCCNYSYKGPAAGARARARNEDLAQTGGTCRRALWDNKGPLVRPALDVH